MTNSTLNNLKTFSFMATLVMSSVAFASDLSPDNGLSEGASFADAVSISLLNDADDRLRRLGSGEEYDELFKVHHGNLKNRDGVDLNFHLCDKSEVLDRVRSLLKEDVSGSLDEKADRSSSEHEKGIAKIFTGMLKEGQNLGDINIHQILQGRSNVLLFDLIAMLKKDYEQYDVQMFNPQTLKISTITGTDGSEVAAKAILREMLSEFYTKVFHIRPYEPVKSAAKGV